MTYKQVIVVRKDLNMSIGKTAGQVAHASLEAALRAKEKNAELFEAWFKNGYEQRKIVLSVNSEEELIQLFHKALQAGYPLSIVEDLGKTELAPGTLTCIAIGPTIDWYIDEITKNLPLLK